MKNRALIVLIFSLLTSFSTSLYAGGGFTVGNGGGLAEFNFEYAALKLPSILQSCLKDARCNLTSNEKNTAMQILGFNQQKLVFKKEREFSQTPSRGKFQNLLKWEGPATIAVNQDELYPSGQPLTVVHGLAALLVLQGDTLTNSTSGRAFADKVLTNSNAITESLSMKSFGYNENGFTFVRLPSSTALVFQDDLRAHSLTSEIEKALLCPSDKQSPRFIAVENLSWGDAKAESLEKVTLSMKSKVYYQCLSGGAASNYSANLEVSVGLRILAGTSQQFMNGVSSVRFELGALKAETAFISAE